MILYFTISFFHIFSFLFFFWGLIQKSHTSSSFYICLTFQKQFFNSVSHFFYLLPFFLFIHFSHRPHLQKYPSFLLFSFFFCVKQQLMGSLWLIQRLVIIFFCLALWKKNHSKNEERTKKDTFSLPSEKLNFKPIITLLLLWQNHFEWFALWPNWGQIILTIISNYLSSSWIFSCFKNWNTGYERKNCRTFLLDEVVTNGTVVRLFPQWF